MCVGVCVWGCVCVGVCGGGRGGRRWLDGPGEDRSEEVDHGGKPGVDVHQPEDVAELISEHA